MGGPLTADENAALMARLGLASPPPDASAAPSSLGAPPLAPPAAPPPVVVAPSAPTLENANAANLPPASLRNAHTAVPSLRHDSSRALAADQTVGYSGPPPAGASADIGSFTMPPEASGGGGTSSGTTSTTVQKGIPISAQTRADLDAARAHSLAANNIEQDAQTGLTAARVQGSEQQAKLMAEQGQAQARLASEGENTLGRKRAHLEAMIDDVRNDKVDPNHFWASKNTGQKMAIAFSMIAGGFAGGWNHQPGQNAGAEMVNRLIEEDMRAQEVNLASKRAAIGQEGQLYEMTRSEFHDKAEQMKAAHVTALAAAQKELDGAIASAEDPIQRARLMQTRAGLEEKAGEAHLRLDELGADKMSKTTSSTFHSGGGSGGNDKLRAQLTELTSKYQSAGDPPAVARQRAAFDLGLRDEKGLPTLAGKTQNAKLDEQQVTAEKSLAAIERSKREVGAITEGTYGGAIAARTYPAWVPGVSTAIKNDTTRGKYNDQVKIAVGGAYKLGTDATEPKNRAMVEEYAHPFEITPKDNEETALAKMEALQSLVRDNAPQGVNGGAPAGGYSYLKPSGVR